MEPDDNSYIRVILHPDDGHTVLDAHRVGDILFHFHRSTFRGQIRNSTDLPNQVALLYTLIERFGPNQVVGVPAFGDRQENLSFERFFFSETLHSCLSLPYILRFILIHRVPESSLPPRHIFPQVIRGGWEEHSFRDWWPVFQHYWESSSFCLVLEKWNTYGRFLFNGAPYSQRPIQDHCVQQADRQDTQQT
jgi:hypothetical protein